MPETEIEGGCNCGAVRYRLTGKPMVVAVCHCSNCRRQSGSAFSVNVVLRDDAIGIVGEVVPEGTLEARGKELAERIARGPTRAFGRFKALIDGAPTRSLADQLEAERIAFVAATETQDFHEGVAAFLGKRAPVFTGR